MNITAEKMLDGVVCNIQEGSVNSEVHIRLPSGETMTAVMTRLSVKKLGLSIGKPLFRYAALAASPPVPLVVDQRGQRGEAMPGLRRYRGFQK